MLSLKFQSPVIEMGSSLGVMSNKCKTIKDNEIEILFARNGP